MLNMESPQMYDTVQTLSQLDLKKPPSSAVIGQITLTAMANISNGNNIQQHHNNNNVNVNQQGSGTNGAGGLVVKQQQSAHNMQQAAAANNNNNSSTTNNNNSNNNNNNNNTNNANSILQKHIMQQYAHNELDELAAQEITLDLAHLIDDNFRESELGLFSDMVAATSPTTLSNTLQTNGVVAAAKVLQMQQQQSLNRQQNNNNGYERNNLLAYTPQAVHSNATYTSNNSSDDNSSLASESSTIKEEPLDPQEYRRQFQEVANNNFMSNNNVNGIYGLSAYGANGAATNSFNGVGLHHQNLPHLGGGHLGLKHHKSGMGQSRKQQQKSLDKSTDEYRKRRERNNIAVRKSREKAKVRSREVEEKVKTLIKEKEQLLRRLEEMNNEMQVHQQIYLQLMNHANPEITRICGTLFNVNNRGN